jgi:hypothetical protein
MLSERAFSPFWSAANERACIAGFLAKIHTCMVFLIVESVVRHASPLPKAAASSVIKLRIALVDFNPPSHDAGPYPTLACKDARVA